MRKEFERVTPESVGIGSEMIEELLDNLDTSYTEMHGIMIMRHGKVCAEGWWHPYAPGIPHMDASLTKSYIGTAVGIAYTEGKLRLEERIADIFGELLPENPGEYLSALQIRDVLCMGNGMESEPYPTKNWIRDFLGTEIVHEPGTAYYYNSTGSSILAAVIERKTGVRADLYLAEKLFSRIGIDAEKVMWMYMPDGTPVGGGGLFTTTEDNLRLFKLYADGGVWEGERILAADYVEMAVTVQNKSSDWEREAGVGKEYSHGYGFQIWRCGQFDAYRGDGAMGQFAIVFPALDMIIAMNETCKNCIDQILYTIYKMAGRIHNEVLPENPQASARLAKRMQRLSLAERHYHPDSPIVPMINGKTYTVKNGGFTLYTSFESPFTGGTFSSGIRQFSFDFKKDICYFRFVENGEERCMEIGLEGNFHLSRIPVRDAPESLVYAAGWFASENEFRMTVCWPETFLTRQFSIRFKEAEAEIYSPDNEFPAVFPQPEMKAAAAC